MEGRNPPPLLAKRPKPTGHRGRDPSFSLPPRCLACRPPRWPTATPHVALVTHRGALDPKAVAFARPAHSPSRYYRVWSRSEDLHLRMTSHPPEPARVTTRFDSAAPCCQVLPLLHSARPPCARVRRARRPDLRFHRGGLTQRATVVTHPPFPVPVDVGRSPRRPKGLSHCSGLEPSACPG